MIGVNIIPIKINGQQSWAASGAASLGVGIRNFGSGSAFLSSEFRISVVECQYQIPIQNLFGSVRFFVIRFGFFGTVSVLEFGFLSDIFPALIHLISSASITVSAKWRSLNLQLMALPFESNIFTVIENLVITGTLKT